MFGAYLKKLTGRAEEPKPAPRRTLRVMEAFGPPLTEEELSGNLSLLENKLNRAMTCPAGKNQVYVRSVIAHGTTTKPRIALKCQLRKQIGKTPEVFYEHIRDVCCGNHQSCPAWQQMNSRRVPT